MKVGRLVIVIERLAGPTDWTEIKYNPKGQSFIPWLEGEQVKRLTKRWLQEKKKR